MKLKLSVKKLLLGFLFVIIIAISAVSCKMIYEINKPLGKHTKVVNTSQFKTISGKLAIKNINVLSENSELMIPNQTVLINESTIISIGDAVPIPNDYNIIDGDNKYLIPGLIDSHVHLKKSKNDLLLYLANGITYIGEMTGMKEHFTYAKEIGDSSFLGPRIYIASPKVSSKKTFMATLRSWFERRHQNFTTEKAIRRAIRQYKSKGYKAIKLSSGLYERELYFALIDEAKKENIPVIGHLPPNINMEDLYTSGQSQLSHIASIIQSEMNEYGGVNYKNAEAFMKYFVEKADSIAMKLKENNITISSTLWIYENMDKQDFDLKNFLKTIKLEYQNPGWVEPSKFSGGWLPGTGNSYNNPYNTDSISIERSKIYWDSQTKVVQEMTRALSRHKVTITAGTDANGANGVVPGFSLHDELESLYRVGLSTSQILHSATLATSQWMGINTGKIKVGFDADLVILEKNPLENIQNTNAINGVIANGKYLNRDTLNKILQAVKEANNRSREVSIDDYLD